MTIALGDAALNITIRPGSTERELQVMEDTMRRIREEKAAQERDLQDMDRKSQEQKQQFKADVDKAKADSPSVKNRVKMLIDKFLAPVQASADVGELLLPKLGQAIESGVAGTPLAGAGEALNDQIQMLATQIAAIRSDLNAIKPTVSKVVAFNLAALRLGGKFPDDQDELIKQIWEIQSAQENLQRNLKRDIDNQSIDLIFQATKQVAGGGR